MRRERAESPAWLSSRCAVCLSVRCTLVRACAHLAALHLCCAITNLATLHSCRIRVAAPSGCSTLARPSAPRPLSSPAVGVMSAPSVSGGSVVREPISGSARQMLQMDANGYSQNHAQYQQEHPPLNAAATGASLALLQRAAADGPSTAAAAAPAPTPAAAAPSCSCPCAAAALSSVGAASPTSAALPSTLYTVSPPRHTSPAMKPHASHSHPPPVAPMSAIRRTWQLANRMLES